jgi:F-type H+-transporting ATPase subunit epsilon
MSLDLEILVPYGALLRTRAASVQAADSSGRFGILPGHTAFLTVLVPCVLMYREPGGGEKYAAIDAGVVMADRDRVSIVARDAVLAPGLEEVADAAQAMFEGRRGQEHTARAAFAELETSLLRELRKAGRTS